MKQFQVIYVAGNPIASIEDHAFAGLSQLEILEIVACDLTSMPPIADVKDTLIRLALRENHIAFVPHDYFTGCRKLRMLSLEDNLLTEIPDVTDLARTLFDLRLPNNAIVNFPNWMLQVSMAQLEFLELFHNQIEVFPPMIFCHQPRLRSINLAGNNLTSLAWYHDVTRSIKATIDVKDNPLHCNGSLAWLSRHNDIRHDDVFASTVEYVGGQCGSPPQLRGRALDAIGVYRSVQSNPNDVQICL